MTARAPLKDSRQKRADKKSAEKMSLKFDFINRDRNDAKILQNSHNAECCREATTAYSSQVALRPADEDKTNQAKEQMKGKQDSDFHETKREKS